MTGDRPYYDLSASRIKRHTKCPEQYRQRYVLGREGTKARKGYGEAGSLVHMAIENVLTERPDERNEEALVSRFKQEFYQLEDSEEIDDTLIDGKQRSDMLDCLETAAAWLAKPEQDVEIRALEDYIYYKINEVGRTVLGHIDVSTMNGIWDWKTGRIRGKDTERDEIIQGAIYMGGYYDKYGEMPERICFIYLKEGKVHEVDPSEQTWETMMTYARRLVNAERQNKFPADPEESKCYFCAYEMFCSQSAVSPGQVNEAVENGNTEMFHNL